jgi:hypothetical protein
VLVLLDELNRAPPKAQASLFSAMAEKIVPLNTLDEKFKGQTIRNTEFDLIVATQNPSFQEGTYPLPEAQLDRFLAMVRVPFLDNLEDLLLADEPAREGSDEHEAQQAQMEDTLRTHQEEEQELREMLDELSNPPEPDRKRKAFYEYCTLIAEKLKKYLDAASTAEDREKSRLNLVQTLKELAKSAELLQDVHRSLLAPRIQYIESIREAIRDRVIVTREMCRYISDYTYFTWSRTAARELAPEIFKRIMDEDEFQNGPVANVRQGVMPRGAQGLRDLAKALCYAEATPAEIEKGGIKLRHRDVDRVAPFVLAHRITLGAAAMVSDDSELAPPAGSLAEYVVDQVREKLHDIYRIKAGSDR